MPSIQTLVVAGSGAAFFAYWVTAFLILYHLTRFGVGVQPKRFAAIFLLGSIAIFTAAVILLSKINWQTLTLS